jgi:hypothetical protein
MQEYITTNYLISLIYTIQDGSLVTWTIVGGVVTLLVSGYVSWIGAGGGVTCVGGGGACGKSCERRRFLLAASRAPGCTNLERPFTN